MFIQSEIVCRSSDIVNVTFAMKYGGSSPNAVPAPQRNASNRTLLIMLHNDGT